MQGLVTFAYFAARLQPGYLRATLATVVATSVILYPFFYGKTNLGLADFGLVRTFPCRLWPPGHSRPSALTAGLRLPGFASHH